MGVLEALFLVNGGPGSAGGERAERIAAQMGRGAADVVYRPAGRGGALRQMAAELRKRRPRVAYSVDLAVAPVAAWALAGSGSRLIVDTGDTPKQFLELIDAPGWRVALANQLERVGYGQSARIIVRGEHHADQVRDLGHDNVTVIPDGVDLSFFRPHDVDELRERLGLAHTLTVGIQGNFTWYPQLGGGLGWELVEALGRNPGLDAHIVLIGDGPGVAELRLLADRHGIATRLHVMGRVPYPELPRYLSLCDATLLTQTNDPSSWARTTGKLPGYLAAGRHIVGTRVGTAAGLLPEHMLLDYHGAWDVSYPDRLAGRLAELSADLDRTRQRGLDVIELAQPFDYDIIAKRCASEIHEVAA